MATRALGLFAAAPKPGEPVAIAKGDGFVVHALGGAVHPFLAEHPETALHLLHTALPGGRLTVLFRSGTTVSIPVPMGLNRVPYSQTRVVGVAADAERLYVLVWSAKWTVLDLGGAVAKPPESDAYAVRVFWLADGSEVGRFDVGGEKRPKTVPRESTEAGPLAVEKGGVSAYGEAFQIEGKGRMK